MITQEVEQELLAPPRALIRANPLLWLRFFGPGAIVASLTLGSGETLFASRGGSTANIAIGTDMDGGFGAEATPTDVDTVADLQGFGPVLEEAGFSSDDITGILYGNALRLFRKTWS